MAKPSTRVMVTMIEPSRLVRVRAGVRVRVRARARVRVKVRDRVRVMSYDRALAPVARRAPQQVVLQRKGVAHRARVRLDTAELRHVVEDRGHHLCDLVLQ